MTNIQYLQNNIVRPICLLSLLFISCKKESVPILHITKDSIETKAERTPQKETTLSQWDFDGDGEADDSISDSLTKGEGNPAEDGTPDSYTLIFGNPTLPDLPIGCCEAIPVGEGDLNGDGKAELSIVQAPMNGCVYTLTTWSFANGKWKQVFGPELIPTGCEGINGIDLKGLIIKENNKVYFYKTDVNDENFKKVKTEVNLK